MAIETAGKLERRFTAASFGLRWLFALVLVVLTYNPTRFNFLRWVWEAYQASPSTLGPLHALAALALLVGWVVFLQATGRSLGLLGVALVAAIFGVLVWMLVFYDVVSTDQTTTLIWIALIGVAFILAIGMSWSHVRRRLSGQADVDEVDTR